MESSDEFIGSNIRTLRDSRGMTQSELSDKTGLTVKSISEIENGHNQIRSENIKLFAAALGCTEIEIITGINPAVHVDLVDQLLKSLNFPEGRRMLALFLLSGKESYIDSFLSWKASRSSENESQSLSRAVKALQKLAT